uniref:ditrans,polycis-polyprenyl diphosphate synthase [(2E,6E)-farnesyldiphosphate specific] n=1 Tax=Triticum urartu TaxID=4572 RepID=A0A8R7UB48_TRIUA
QNSVAVLQPFEFRRVQIVNSGVADRLLRSCPAAAAASVGTAPHLGADAAVTPPGLGEARQRRRRSLRPAARSDVSTINDYKAHFGFALYRNLQLGKLKYLAIVVDSREAKNTVKINQLLYWLKTLGVKYVCLYDIDGVLKKLFEPGMNGSRDNNPGDYLDVSANIKALDCCQKQMTIECISGSDGKEGIAKAANLLCSTYLNGDSHTQEDVKSEVNVKNEPVFTETDMASALKSIDAI